MDDLLIGPQSDEYFDSIYMWEFYLDLLSELNGDIY